MVHRYAQKEDDDLLQARKVCSSIENLDPAEHVRKWMKTLSGRGLLLIANRAFVL